MAIKKKHYAKVKVWGENVIWSGEGPLMGVIQEMFQSVPEDNHKFLVGRLQSLSPRFNDIDTESGAASLCTPCVYLDTPGCRISGLGVSGLIRECPKFKKK